MNLHSDNLTLAEIIHGIRNIGVAVNPEVMAATLNLYSPHHFPSEARITRNIQYGAHERNVCNLYQPCDVLESGLPVVVFVHGGGFVRGDKEILNTPFYDNVGLWAARNGFVGITMNYRLAPEFMWPSGGNDVGNLLSWLVREVHPYGGDPNKIFIIGHSAGASHVATCLSRLESFEGTGGKVRGAALVSGIYDLEPLAVSGQVPVAYFGSNQAAYADMSISDKLAALKIPVLYAVNELEPEMFRSQGYQAAIRSMNADSSKVLRFVLLPGHNHFSCIFNMNLPINDLFGNYLTSFIEASL